MTIKQISILVILLFIAIIVIRFNLPASSEDLEVSRVRASTPMYEGWTLIKSDTIPSRLQVMKDQGISDSIMADICSGYGPNTLAKITIVNYFSKNGKIKQLKSFQ